MLLKRKKETTMRKMIAIVTLLCLPPVGWIILAAMYLGKIGVFND